MRQPRWRSASPNSRQPEVVALARRAGQQRARPHAAVPAPGQRDQPPAQHHAREVLLRDRGLAALPALAQLAQVGQQHVARQGVEAQPGDEQVEHDLRPRVVEVVEGLAQLVGHAFQRWGQPGGRRLGREHQACGLARRHPGTEVAHHRLHAILVGRGVEAEAAVGALRLEQAVAALPRPQDVGGHLRAPRQLTDAQARFHVPSPAPPRRRRPGTATPASRRASGRP